MQQSGTGFFYFIMAKEVTGWIRLYRSSFNNRLYFSEPFTRWQAWCDLLLLANHKSGMFRVRGIKVEVLRGQTGFSAVELADRWRWSRGKINRFLVELKDEHQIVQQKSNVTTLISIVNYDKYQTDGTADGTLVGTLVEQKTVHLSVHETDINKNDNNIKEDKKVLNIKPVATDFNGLPEIQIGSLIRFFKITKQIDVSEEQVIGLWEIFKTQKLVGKKPYADESEVYSHFINWGITKKIENNGKSTSSTVGKEIKFDRP